MSYNKNSIDYHFSSRVLNGDYIGITPFEEAIPLIKTSMDYFYLLELYFAIVCNDTIENCERCIDLIKDKECINSAMELLNKYKRTDLIAILLDKKKEIDLSEDFEL